MQDYELDYAELINEILDIGSVKKTRNGETKSVFGKSLVIDNLEKFFPLIQGRKMYYAGIFGEFAALVRGPKHIDDFKKWGCNYWDKWAKDDGSINVDYGNAWFDFEGIDQILALKHMLRYDPNNRRMIVSGWRPHMIHKLDLPCCHYSYQFHISNGMLNMIWTQRSVDMMIGLPADIVLAALWVITLANEIQLTPGYVKMDLGDCHVYEEHYDKAQTYIDRVYREYNSKLMAPVHYLHLVQPGADFLTFEPTDITIGAYDHLSPIELELIA